MHGAKGVDNPKLLFVVDAAGISGQGDRIDEPADFPVVKVLASGKEEDDVERLIMIGGAAVTDPHALGRRVDEEVMEVVDAENIRDGLDHRHRLQLL